MWQVRRLRKLLHERCESGSSFDMIMVHQANAIVFGDSYYHYFYNRGLRSNNTYLGGVIIDL